MPARAGLASLRSCLKRLNAFNGAACAVVAHPFPEEAGYSLDIMQDRTMRLRTDSAQTLARDVGRPFAPRWVFQACLLIYVVALAWVTLRPRPSSFQPPAEWIPLNNIIGVLREGRSVSYEDAGQLLGNIALFVPFGWLVPMLWQGLRSFWTIVILAAATSLAIEVSQWLFIFGRQSSIDDVILNTVGAFVGAVMFFAPRKEP